MAACMHCTACRLPGCLSSLVCVLKRPNLAVSGYMHCARTHVRLDEVLDTIRDNLRREQKTVMELNSAPHVPIIAHVTGHCHGAHYLQHIWYLTR